MRLSYSAINTFQTCPLMYKFQYIDKIPTKTNAKLEFGSILHLTLKFILNDPYHLPSKEDILKYYSENFPKSEFESEKEANNYFQAGINIINTFLRQIKIQKPKTLITEDKFAHELGKHTVSGIIDRVDKIDEDNFEVIDYKTGRVANQKKVDTDLQLTTYYFATLKRWPHIKNIKLSLHFLGPNIKLSTTRDKRNIDQLNQVVHKTAEKIDSGKFPATPGPLCNWCDFGHLCPVMKDRFRKKEHQIDQVLTKYLELKEIEYEIKSEQKRLQPLIHDYLEKEKVEKVFSDLGTVSGKNFKIYEYDPKKIEKVLKPHGKWIDVVKIDNTKLTKIIDQLGLSEKDIDQIKKARKLQREQKKLYASLKKKK